MLVAVGGGAIEDDEVLNESIEGNFISGSGTLQDPYMIYDVNDLQNMSANLTANYALANHIDASETSGWNGGDGFVPVGWSLLGIGEDSYAFGTVTRNIDSNETSIGGFIGYNEREKVINYYSIGNVHYTDTNDPTDKGFAGLIDNSTASFEMRGNFWDIGISKQTGTEGNATGSTTTEMKDISTFTNVGWDIVGVADVDSRDAGHIWNLVDTETYPFLSRQDEVHIPVVYELTIHSTDGGEVITPCEGNFPYLGGSIVDLVATPDANYHFVEWIGDTDTIADPSEAETTIVLEGDYTITANFAINEHDLTIDSTDGGSVTVSGEGTYTHDYGTVFDLVATPDAGYHFVGWTGYTDTIADVTSATTTITMNGDHEITAVFSEDVIEEETFVLTVNIIGNGTVSINPEQDEYAEGTNVTLTATPDEGWVFVEWTGAVTGTDDEITIKMTENKTITAVFQMEEDDDVPPDDDDDSAGFLSQYWWLIALIVVGAALALVFVMKGKQGSPVSEDASDDTIVEDMLDDDV